jgi:flagellar assembly protein FliH
MLKSDLIAMSHKFKLHYFPEIPSGTIRKNECDSGTEFSFQSTVSKAAKTIPESEVRKSENTVSKHTLIVQKAREKAFLEGYEKGIQEGRAVEAKKIDTALTSLNSAISEIDVFKSKLCQHAESGVLEFALKIAEKVIAAEVESNPNTILGVVQSAMEKVLDQNNITIKVHSRDLKILETAKGEVFGNGTEQADIHLLSDNSVGLGGCIVETDFGDIDARINQQLKIIAELMRQKKDHKD